MNLSQISKTIRRTILQMHARSNASHIGSALSCVDLVTALYFAVLNVDPIQPDDPDRDRFILSKGHASSALYAVLAECGFFDKKILDGYFMNNGTLPGHVTKGCVPGIELSTGSLGHGLPVGAGMALAARRDGRKSRTVVLLSDGECNEGSVWEAAAFARQHQLDNLTAIVDYNKIQSFGRTEEVMDLEPFAAKWKAFGWAVKEINGHDPEEIVPALKSVPFVTSKPSAVIAHTVKGKGVSFMEDQLAWHYRSPDDDQLKKAIEELSSL